MIFSQGDIIKISGFRNKFIIVSKNAFIKATKVFHVCPMVDDLSEGPLHIRVVGKSNEEGIVICEQVKFIDPSVRSCNKIDCVPYHMIMNVSDAIQCIFEYD